jgi:hypothetical protein
MRSIAMDKNKLERALDELMVLNIRTVVGDFSTDKNGYLHYDADKAEVILTQINLVQGDITTAFGRAFLEPPYDTIRQFHSEREQQGHDIVQGNLAMLMDAAKALATWSKEQAAPPADNVVSLTGT